MVWSGTGVLPPAYGLGQPVFDGDAPGEYGAAVPASCEKYKRLRAEALRKMWKTPIFTRKRRAYELQANEYAARYRACLLRARRGGKPSFKPSTPASTRVKLPAQDSIAPGGGASPPAFTPSAPAAPSSGPPVAVLAGGAALLALVALFALSGGSKQGEKTGSFTVPRARATGTRRVAR